MPREISLSTRQREEIDDLVRTVRNRCPGESEFRYLSYIRSDPLPHLLASVSGELRSQPGLPLVVTGLPQYENIQDSKILSLLLGESIGNCVAYSDYNQSYLTDIRPTSLSKESSAGESLLGMHNDFPFIGDNSRPRHLVLLAHRAHGVVPMTFLAPADDVLARLDRETRSELTKRQFEARAGGKLAWKNEQIFRFPLLVLDGQHTVIRFHFDSIEPAADLPKGEAAAANRALGVLGEAALAVGRKSGHRILEGEALIIPNDHCLHGRDAMDGQKSERMLLRAYVAPDSVVKHHRKTMITLDA